jgi:outer membrane cobalamin receptor
LNFLPGAVISVGAKGEGEFSLRGAIGRDTKLYIDGRQTASPWEGKLDYSRIPLATVSGIAVIKGPPPLEYGSNLGGVVEITTVDPTERPTTNLSLQYGSGEFKEASIQQSLSFRKVTLIGEISAENRAGYPLPVIFHSTQYENGGLRDNSDNRRYSAFLKAKFRAFSAPVTLSGGFSDEVRGIPPNAQEFPYRWRFKSIESYFADLQRTGQASGWSYQSHLYFDGYYNRLKRYTNSNSNYEESDYIYDSIHRSGTFGFNQDANIKINRRLNLNLGWRTAYHLFARQEQTPTSAGFSAPTYNHSWQADVFVEAKLQIALLYEASGGLGVQNLWGESDDAWSYMTPRIGFSAIPMKDLRIAFNVVRSVQFPTFNHLYSEASGNPELQPETAWRGEIGGQYHFNERLTASAWYYRSYIEGRIDRPDRYSPFQNYLDSRLWGEELVLEYKTVSKRISLGITQQNVEMIIPPNATFTPLGVQVAPWKIDLNLFSKVNLKCDLALNAGYLAPWKDNEGNNLGEHTLLDINIRYSIYPGFRMSGSVENLFDQEYSMEYGFPQAGRVWKVGLEWSRTSIVDATFSRI